MAKRILTEEENKDIAMLWASNDMLLESIEEAKQKKPDAVRRIEEARADIVAKLESYGIDVEAEMEKRRKKEGEDDIMDAIVWDEETDFIQENVKNVNQATILESKDVEDDVYTTYEDDKVENSQSDVDFGDIDPDVQYDIIPLPSNGQCYPSKTERLPVGYLTAYDENLITSPNLYKNGLIIDFLLKRKVLNKNFDIDKLVSGDADAIILFLRATSYGVEFPVVVRDPESGDEINAVIDLSELKYKEFNLVGDENGWFDFELPVSKVKVKFRYLTRRDEKILTQLSKSEENGAKAVMLDETIKSLRTMLKSDNVLTKKEADDCKATLGHLKAWRDKLLDSKSMPFQKLITNRMELCVMSVNGNQDRKYISKFVRNMAAKDALMLRRYIIENEPGVNFEIEVKRPESLGGGSFKTFLEWGDTVFFNIN